MFNHKVFIYACNRYFFNIGDFNVFFLVFLFECIVFYNWCSIFEVGGHKISQYRSCDGKNNENCGSLHIGIFITWSNLNPFISKHWK